MHVLRRLTILAAAAALLAAAVYAGVALGHDHEPRPAADRAPSAGPTEGSSATPSPSPSTDTTTGATTSPATTPTTSPAAVPTEPPASPKATKKMPEPKPGPALLSPGDQGDEIRDLQARLAQIDWFNAGVTGYYGDVTEAAVRGFQGKRGFPVTGEVDQRTQDRLREMTTQPTDAELAGTVSTNTPGALDPRCTTGRALCIDKTSRTLRWVVDGRVLKTVDVRFGASYTPTREGEFQVYLKDADHVSHLYGSSMPYSMFFSGGQAVHYSSDFATVGYDGASHGCVNVRDLAAVRWLFDRVQIGDKAVVYWS